MTLSETDIIRRFFQRGSTGKSTNRADVTIGIGDDAAAVRVPPGMELICATDTIVEGVHFPVQFPAADTGYRVLAVNLSDLAAMGAQPAWALLSLALPAVDENWLSGFCDGFFALADDHDVALIGGDLVKGPLTATVTLLGYCPTGTAITRSGAKAGDGVYVTGSPGAASLGLDYLLNANANNQTFEQYFCRPVPRVDDGISLRGIASAMIDISDGLLKDAGRLAACSGVKISFDAVAIDEVASGGLSAALSGGDDYELCFTVPAQKQEMLVTSSTQWGCKPHRIGQVESGRGISMPGHDLTRYSAFDHFAPVSD